MGVMIDIVKVAEDDHHAAYNYAKSESGAGVRPGLIMIDKQSGAVELLIKSTSVSDLRDGIDAQASVHKLRKAFDGGGDLPDKLTYAAG